MKRVISVLCISIATCFGAGSLHSEAQEVLERLMAQGYSGAGIIELKLELMEPCTLSLYPPLGSGGGFYIGLGGNNILDLGLRLCGGDWIVEDSMPDDYPVLRVDSAEVAGGDYLIICASEMIRGFLSDSAIVLWAFSPVDRYDQ